MDTNTSNNWAYLGGLFDGEGHAGLGFYHMGRKDKDGKLRRYPRLTARITNTDKSILEWVKQFTGVGIISGNGNMRNYSKKPCYYWITTTASARKFLHQILPWTRIKKIQIENVLEKETKLVIPK